MRRLFGLLRNEAASREEFLASVASELEEPVRDEVARQTRQRDNADVYWQERGGLAAATTALRDAIVDRYRRWLSDDLRFWMTSVYAVLDEDVWVGTLDESGGAVDILLLADAVGLQAYNWNLDVQRSPFRRLDVIAGADPALVVLAELYAQSIAAYA